MYFKYIYQHLSRIRFYVKKGKNKSYLDTYTLGIEEDVIDQWIRENQIDKKKS